MRIQIARPIALALLVLFTFQSVWATCGGGGGGGTGGISGGSAANPEVYPVPWKIRTAKDAPPSGLVLYWVPASVDEYKKSSLRFSRSLSLYASQCVTMELAESASPLGQKLLGNSQPPVAVLMTAEGTEVTRVENKNGKLRVEQLEKAVETEMKQREGAVASQLKEGKEKQKAGDNEGAIKLFNSVVAQKCLFPGKAKDAAKELKKLGVTETAEIPEAPVFEAQRSAAIERTMQLGLRAEIAERYVAAEKFYTRAHRLDPADPAPLRYLGELYRHHFGDWDKARALFEEVLKMPADPLSRAVALHGLGKMTIHDGEFKKGLALMEQSIEAFPLALTYRNLAVYWNSEGDPKLGNEYTQKALALDPKDSYNIVFAAVFMVPSGQRDEALQIARKNINLLPASYNLAAIYAQTGQREKALVLLKRHFFRYERYDSVRAKEMMEARVDAVFDSLRQDPAFLALTKGADGKLQMPMRNMSMPASPDRR
jgi:tetratricopeptide (TPR) repeat protein